MSETPNSELERQAMQAMFAKDFVAFQKAITNPHKSADNPAIRGAKYIKLDDLLEFVRPILTKHRLAVTQILVTHDNGRTGVRTDLIHAGGYIKVGEPCFLPVLQPGRQDKETAQGVGSACTYARRYSLEAALGIAGDEDDDGHRASHGAGQAAAQPGPERKARFGSDGPWISPNEIIRATPKTSKSGNRMVEIELQCVAGPDREGQPVRDWILLSGRGKGIGAAKLKAIFQREVDIDKAAAHEDRLCAELFGAKVWNYMRLNGNGYAEVDSDSGDHKGYVDAGFFPWPATADGFDPQSEEVRNAFWGTFDDIDF